MRRYIKIVGLIATLVLVSPTSEGQQINLAHVNRNHKLKTRMEKPLRANHNLASRNRFDADESVSDKGNYKLNKHNLETVDKRHKTSAFEIQTKDMLF